MSLNKELNTDKLKIEDRMAQLAVVELTEENFKSHIGSYSEYFTMLSHLRFFMLADRYDLVVIIFYVDTCKFSQKWKAILEDIVDRTAVEFDVCANRWIPHHSII